MAIDLFKSARAEKTVKTSCEAVGVYPFPRLDDRP
jgi:hypothetical protein